MRSDPECRHQSGSIPCECPSSSCFRSSRRAYAQRYRMGTGPMTQKQEQVKAQPAHKALSNVSPSWFDSIVFNASCAFMFRSLLTGIVKLINTIIQLFWECRLDYLLFYCRTESIIVLWFQSDSGTWKQDPFHPCGSTSTWNVLCTSTL